MIPLVLSMAMSLTTATDGLCGVVAGTRVRLQSSEPAKLLAPDHAWQIETHPKLNSEENQTPVSLRSCANSGLIPLFVLQRSAEAYWSPRNSAILIVDEPLSGTSRLLLFNVKAVSQGSKQEAPDTINLNVRDAIASQLGDKRHVEFYLPRYVRWNGNRLLLP
jgi:hypothetical protein